VRWKYEKRGGGGCGERGGRVRGGGVGERRGEINTRETHTRTCTN